MPPRRRRDSYGIRIFLLGFASIVLIGLIGVRLFSMQIVSGAYWRQQAEGQHTLEQELQASRGEIFVRERDGGSLFPVVSNVNRPLLSVVPQQVKDAAKLAGILADTFQMDRKDVLAKITDQSKKYVPIVREVSEDVVEKLAGQKLPGVYFENQIFQSYPEGSFASQVLGFVAYEQDKRVGRYGLEYEFEDELAGLAGKVEGVRDPKGNWITGGGNRKLTPPVDGTDLVLTIDRAIQNKVETVLARTVQEHSAITGSIIVMAPKTGAILAMANYPSFDPNKFNEVNDPKLFNNPTIQTPYEPGSIMKPLTMAGALEEGAITPDMKFTDPGSVTLENFTIRNSQNKVYGEATMTQVLEESINTGAIFVEQKIGHEKFRRYFKAFGLGQLTGIQLPFESKGNVQNLYKGGDLYPATAAFGQGFTATPLQMAAAYAAIANGGTFYKPFIVAEKRYSDGRVETVKPDAERTVISAPSASTLAAMLVSVVERGHGKRAGVPGYYIAGKTGTAQVAYENRSGYDPNRTIGSFAGFGPVDNPVFAMIVKIDEPKDVRFAESTAAPAFGEIAQFILNYYQVPKSR